MTEQANVIARGLTFREHLDNYLDARGMRFFDLDLDRGVDAIWDELEELSQAQLSKDIRHEIADVILATVVFAESCGFTVEDCIREKTAHDRGRGK